jgi:sugar O-acyltransferase (sialic acid O-acetyltransferase NeuD family)
MMSEKLRRKEKKPVIVGAGPFAEVACECFDADSPYEVVAFAVERPFVKTDTLLGRPVIAFEDLGQTFPPDEHEVYVAIAYTQLNRLRTRLLNAAKRAGYRAASYMSPSAFVRRNVEVGEHCFIGDHTVIHPFASIGNNVILWSGNHIGHHTRVRDNVFVAMHGVVAGNSDVGTNVFIGANACIADGVAIATDCWIAPGATIVKDTEEGQFYRGPKSEVGRISTRRFVGLED